VWQYVTNVPLKQGGKGVTLRFSGREVPSFDGRAFSHLCPFASV